MQLRKKILVFLLQYTYNVHKQQMMWLLVKMKKFGKIPRAQFTCDQGCAISGIFCSFVEILRSKRRQFCFLMDFSNFLLFHFIFFNNGTSTYVQLVNYIHASITESILCSCNNRISVVTLTSKFSFDEICIIVPSPMK